MSRRFLRRCCLGVAAAGAAWSVWLLAGGGASVRLFGAALTSHDPVRPFLVAATALSVFVLAGGRVPLPSRAQLGRTGTAVRGAAGAIAGAVARRVPSDRSLALMLSMAVLAVGVWYGARAVGGADSYAYASEADRWLAGRVPQAQPWAAQVPWPRGPETFTPIGYKVLPSSTTIVPMYAPGLSLLMAGAKAVAGQCGIFSITPIGAALLVLATYGLGVRLGSSRSGLIGAWLVATSPVVLFMLQGTMSDIPGAAAWAAAFYLAFRPGTRAAAGAGAATGLAVLIRLNLAPMAGLIGGWYLVTAVRARPGARAGHVRRGIGFALGLAPFAAAALLINWQVNGSPWRLGYGDMSDWFGWSHVVPNLRAYGRWFVESETPIGLLGVVTLLAPVGWWWRGAPDRSAVVLAAAFVCAVVAEYCVYAEFGAWWFLRFLLPCWPFVMVGTGRALEVLGRPRRILLSAALFVTVIWVGVFGVRFAVRESVFDLGRGDSKFASTGRLVAAVTEPRSVVLSSYHSGSLRYYGGRMTLQFTALDAGWLDRAVTWMSGRGVHVYALLEDAEVDQFKATFSSSAAVRGMVTPIATVDPWPIFLYDLSEPSRTPVPNLAIEQAGRFTCVPPAPPPTIAFDGRGR